MDFLSDVGGILWGPWTFLCLMGAGILFTLWTKFSQYRAMTHGFAVIRGLYDDPNDPGAINHFQALSAALSATVGLGNIGGVALAIGAGGPGALFWMWIIGFLGMALKTVEITLAMMYRNTDDPDNPHGGAMWVVDRVIGGRGGIWKPVGKIIGVFFCLTLIVSTITGGNMFQSWNVASLTSTFWNVTPVVTGIVLAIIVGLVIVGGIKRIGSVAGKLVPFMCLLYLVSALTVLVVHVTDIPAMLALIVKSALSPTEASGAFIGGSIGWAFSVGLRRALFSNEAGQGSAPIAHSAAKTNEPAREGIIGGIGPFIDTICICTLTALVILCTNTWNRAPLMTFDEPPVVSPVLALNDSRFTASSDDVRAGLEVYMMLPPADGGVGAGSPAPSDRLTGRLASGGNGSLIVEWDTYTAFVGPASASLQIMTAGRLEQADHVVGTISALPAATRAVDEGRSDDPADDRPMWGLLTASQAVVVDADKEFLWHHLSDVFIVLEGDLNDDTKVSRHRLAGTATRMGVEQAVINVRWDTIASAAEPVLVEGTGMFRDYNGASLTAHAFDRQYPGLGKILITVAAWLFAVSTMISWSYYGEQGMIYMLGRRSVLPYKLIYLAAIIFAANWIHDTSDMETLMDIGTGAMLWSNIPIVVILGFLAVRCNNTYNRRLKAGEFPRRGAPSITDVMEGKNVE
ncbi:MAG: sodium:alanine symporter family protein [Phycisphaerales bacterium]|nr:sodium:alanine symporter family protein [Phycisphaerales bacterium]